MKQQLTELQANRLIRSMQAMIIMNEVMAMEYASDLVDGRFKNPKINQFNKRIKTDLEAIKFHLLHNECVPVRVVDTEFTEDYAGEMYRVFQFFLGLPVEQVNKVMDNLMQESHAIEL